MFLYYRRFLALSLLVLASNLLYSAQRGTFEYPTYPQSFTPQFMQQPRQYPQTQGVLSSQFSQPEVKFAQQPPQQYQASSQQQPTQQWLEWTDPQTGKIYVQDYRTQRWLYQNPITKEWFEQDPKTNLWHPYQGEKQQRQPQRGITSYPVAPTTTQQLPQPQTQLPKQPQQYPISYSQTQGVPSSIAQQPPQKYQTPSQQPQPSYHLGSYPQPQRETTSYPVAPTTTQQLPQPQTQLPKQPEQYPIPYSQTQGIPSSIAQQPPQKYQAPSQQPQPSYDLGSYPQPQRGATSYPQAPTTTQQLPQPQTQLPKQPEQYPIPYSQTQDVPSSIAQQPPQLVKKLAEKALPLEKEKKAISPKKEERIDLGKRAFVDLTDENLDKILLAMPYGEQNGQRFSINNTYVLAPANQALGKISKNQFDSLTPDEIKGLLIAMAALLRAEANEAVLKIDNHDNRVFEENRNVVFDPKGHLIGYINNNIDQIVPIKELKEAYRLLKAKKLEEKALLEKEKPTTTVAKPIAPINFPKVDISLAEQSKTYATKPIVPITSPILPISDFSLIRGKSGGSVPGALYQNNTNGKKYLVKYTPRVVARNEILAAELYKKSGIKVPNFILIDPGTDLSIYKQKYGEMDPLITTYFEREVPHLFIGVEFIEGLQSLTADQQAYRDDVLNGFIIDAWLANYDVIGLAYDNILLDKQGNAIRVDIGASLERKAQGGPKDAGFNDQVNEINFLRGLCDVNCLQNLNLTGTVQSSLMEKSATVFGNLRLKHITNGLQMLALFTDTVIREIVEAYGPKETNHKAFLENILKKRRDQIKNYWGPLLQKEYTS